MRLIRVNAGHSTHINFLNASLVLLKILSYRFPASFKSKNNDMYNLNVILMNGALFSVFLYKATTNYFTVPRSFGMESRRRVQTGKSILVKN
jgi:hypothetical protein